MHSSRVLIHKGFSLVILSRILADMSDLRFDTGDNEFASTRDTSSGFDLAGKLVEWGLVSDRQQATYVLIGTGVLALIIAFFLFRSSGSDLPPPPPIGV